MNNSHIVIDLRNSLRMNQREFADFLGVSPSVISNVESGIRSISKALQTTLIEKLDVNPNFLLTGEGPMFRNQQAVSSIDLPVVAPRGIKTIQEAIEGRLIPFLTQGVSAGPGEELLEYDDSSGLICLPAGTAKGDLRALKVKGDSMEPTLRPGDIVVCDMSGWQGDGLYVLKDVESAYVKRVRRVHNGFEVISDNLAYKPWQCPSEDLIIVGRVCFSVVRL